MYELHINSEGKEWSVPLTTGTQWRIGRNESCEIAVPDRRVSGEHAELTLSENRLLLKRTQGQRPIEINGTPVENAILFGGFAFTIGHTVFTVVANRSGMNLIDTQKILAAWTESSTPQPTAAVPAPASSNTSARIHSQSSMRLLAQVVTLLTRSADRPSLANAVLELACQRLNATRALLARVETTQNLGIIATRGIGADADIQSLITTTVLKQIVDERQAVIIGNMAQSDSTLAKRESVLRNHILAVACTPVFNTRGQLFALLYVDNQDRPSEFTAPEAELLIWLGQIYSVLDENLEMRRRLEAEVHALKSAAVAGVQIIADAPSMVLLLERVKRAGASEAAVLILGESGAGKECIARMLHQQSPRASKPFVARNCAAIPENLFESEMFGHRKGSFTGASADRKGAFVEAEGGTLFLDEIGDLDYTLQTKLLRAIQEKVIRPVGGDTDVPVDVRIVAATNKDLRECIKNKQFREDLFYRIATVSLVVPPLRERRSDIVALARHFTRLLSDGARSLTPSAEDRLLAYDWPGNVRELRSIIEQATIFAAGSEIHPEDLNLPAPKTERIDLGSQSLAEVERRHILQTLQGVNGNKTEAARVLGLARSTLLLKLHSYAQQGQYQGSEPKP